MLRKATDADLDQMLTWRNHPVVRAASLDTHEIAAAEHAAWWARSSKSHDRAIYIYEHDDTPAGVVNFTHINADEGAAHWGYYLDNEGLEASGALLQAWMKIQIEALALADDLGLHVLHSEVLEANAGVLAFNKRNGCLEVGRRVDVIDGTPKTVVELRRG